MPSRLPVAAPLAALAALVGLGTLVLTGWPPLATWDTSLSARARAYGHDNPTFIAVIKVLTDVAATIPFLVTGTVATVVLLLFRRYAAAVTAAFVTVAVPVAWSLAHLLLHRPRPADGFVNPETNGFPSGHTANATAMALFAVLLLWPGLGRLGRGIAVALAVAFAVFIGATRLALLAHWPSDVIGGWLLGLVVVPLAIALPSSAAAAALNRRAR